MALTIEARLNPLTLLSGFRVVGLGTVSATLAAAVG
jgi:hypothetical protein